MVEKDLQHHLAQDRSVNTVVANAIADALGPQIQCAFTPLYLVSPLRGETWVSSQ